MLEQPELSALSAGPRAISSGARCVVSTEFAVFDLRLVSMPYWRAIL
ncbi:MAG: hypothetical protein ACOVRM_01180 [Planctomycetaceae bacterium]